MAYFFGINSTSFKSELTISRFQNSGLRNDELLVYSYEIKDSKWEINLVECNYDKNFYYLNEDNIDNRKIFFLATLKEVSNYNFDSLKTFNSFTKSSPAFRCNFKIINSKNGFSSYQSEYPPDMSNKKGSVISSVFALTNKYADNNFVVFRNVFHKPIEIPFSIFIVDMKDKVVLDKFIAITNQTTLIELNDKNLGSDCYLVSEDYLGIPQYLSQKNNHLSLEHTHPPHAYILSNDRFEKINLLKKNALKIINNSNC